MNLNRTNQEYLSMINTMMGDKKWQLYHELISHCQSSLLNRGFLSNKQKNFVISTYDALIGALK